MYYPYSYINGEWTFMGTHPGAKGEQFQALLAHWERVGCEVLAW